MNDTEKMRKAVKKACGQRAEIARRGGLTYFWVRDFCSGKIKDPGGIRLNSLKQALTSMGLMK